MCNKNCPACGKEALNDKSNCKTCINYDCTNHGITYLHHEWVEHVEKHSKPLDMESELDRLMEAF